MTIYLQFICRFKCCKNTWLSNYAFCLHSGVVTSAGPSIEDKPWGKTQILVKSLCPKRRFELSSFQKMLLRERNAPVSDEKQTEVHIKCSCVKVGRKQQVSRSKQVLSKPSPISLRDSIYDYSTSQLSASVPEINLAACLI